MDEGTCLCGAVAYTVDGPLRDATHCHCSYCRKEHGTPYATYAMASASDVHWTRGRDRLVWYESSPGFRRVFCGGCGSTMPGDPFEDSLFIPLGNLSGDPGVRPFAHIFAASRARWWPIRDDLARYDAFPPGMEAAASWPAKQPQDAPGSPRGSCLCGAVAFVLEGEPIRAANCYCGRCRKARAAAHASNFFVALSSLRFTRGEDRVRSYKVPDAKYFAQFFCSTCGSATPRPDASRGMAVIPMGAMDDDPPLLPTMSIFVADKAPWVTITDDLPQYDGPPPA